MPSNSRSRKILVVAIGAAVYYMLLSLVYSNAPYTTPPQWWSTRLGSGQAAVASWFTLLNVAGAVLASTPVAFGLVFAGKVRPSVSALIVGCLTALVVVVGGLIQYGLPQGGSTWIADVVQFLGICGALVGMVTLIRGLPSNKSLERTRDR